MSIVTKTGDKGRTGLFGGKRVPKFDVRIHAYGTVDELNAVLGLVLAEKNIPQELQSQLFTLQRLLFRVGGDLATPDMASTIARVESGHIVEIETWIEGLEGSLPILQKFILPSGSRLGALLHLARTVCRRAERYIVELGTTEELSPHLQIYINRLSDYLFLAARAANKAAGATEQEV